MQEITELARAKVNLTLKVRGRRQDGYHAIESLIVFAAGLGDIVRLEPGAHAALHVSGPFADAIAGKNLVDTALARLAEAEPRLVLGRVAIEKRLPIAAGIGGGSADAAALLRAVRRANPKLAAVVDWSAIAAGLGADVPVCLQARSAFVWGVGEKVEPMAGLPQLNAVLVNPLTAVSLGKTARVFAGLDAPPAGATASAPLVPRYFADAAALIDYMRAEGNDLVAAATAVAPEIGRVQAALRNASGCLFSGLSGAGPTCYGIFQTMEEALAAEGALRTANSGWWVAATALGG